MAIDFFRTWHYLPEDVRLILVEIKDDSGEVDVSDQIMVGPCPNCGSTNTRSCENTVIADSTAGLCLDCGCRGCLVCGAVLDDGETNCPHWRICNNCGEKGEEGRCSHSLWECPAITEWKAGRQYAFEF
jgi:hypothetical protein